MMSRKKLERLRAELPKGCEIVVGPAGVGPVIGLALMCVLALLIVVVLVRPANAMEIQASWEIAAPADEISGFRFRMGSVEGGPYDDARTVEILKAVLPAPVDIGGGVFRWTGPLEIGTPPTFVLVVAFNSVGEGMPDTEHRFAVLPKVTTLARVPEPPGYLGSAVALVMLALLMRGKGRRGYHR